MRLHVNRSWPIVALTIVLLLALSAPALAAGKSATTDIPYDLSPIIKNLPTPHQKYPVGTKFDAGLAGPLAATLGAPDIILTLADMARGGSYDVPFWRVASGAHSDIYVAWNDLAAPSTSSQQDQTITESQIAYMADEFDKVIWASDVFHFGNYDSRTPANQDEALYGKRAQIFVYNIRDEAYWSSYRFYVAGYFSSGLNNELGLNAIFIDSYNWKDRIGEDVARPHLYEGTIAHEFEHLIHSDVDGNEDSFIDEGMADMAEQFIYGTETTSSHIGQYLYYHRDSLIDWKGELFDYGNSVLWQDYLWEHAGGVDLDAPLASRVTAGYEGENRFVDDPAKFKDPGDKFVWNLIHDQSNGLASVADQIGGDMGDVRALFRDYTLANLLDGKGLDPKWGYRNLALGGPDSDGYTIDQGFAYYTSSTVGGNMPVTRKHVPRTVNEAWGAYYRTFSGSSPGFTMRLRAPETNGVSPYSGNREWYGGLGNMLERTLSWHLTGITGGELTFMTWYDIEQDWDYGYVEASTDGTHWTKLAQTSVLPAGVTDKYASTAWDGPGGLTGNSGGWKKAVYSLGGLSGTVDIRFRYATDEAANGQGWYIDDLTVTGLSGDPLDTTTPGAAWTTDPTNGWLYTDGLQHNRWNFDIWKPYAKAQVKSTQIIPVLLVLQSPYWTGRQWVDAQYQKSFKAYGIVSNCPDGTFLSRGELTITKSK